MKCYDKPIVWLRKTRTFLLVFLLSLSLQTALAESSTGAAELETNPFWQNLKVKLVKYLDSTIDKSKYKYEIIGPSTEMKNFLGNRPDAQVNFIRFNLDSSNAHRRSIVAQSGTDQLSIPVNIWKYKSVWVVRRAVGQGGEVTADNVSKQTLPILPQDEQLYYVDNPIQKVATVNIPAGTALRINMLRYEKMIQAGDTVRVVSESAFVKLEFRCRAMNSGDKGDTINLSCPDMKNKTIKAVVTGTGIAELK